MDNVEILEIILIIVVFVFGLIIGLLINSFRKERFRRFTPDTLSAIKKYHTFTPRREKQHSFSELFPPIREEVSPAILFNVRELHEQHEPEKEKEKKKGKEREGAWVCPKCGAKDATLIHRKGCNKCYGK